MSTEERTRTEVIKALIAVSDALTLLLQEREAAPAKIEDSIGEPPPAIRKARAKKEPKVEQAEAETPVQTQAKPELPIPTVGEKMADIKPIKPGKTLADLRIALQECITKYGMPGAKERLAPYLKISDVPDEQIGATIERLAA
jgi:hypothetical protein